CHPRRHGCRGCSAPTAAGLARLPRLTWTRHSWLPPYCVPFVTTVQLEDFGSDRLVRTGGRAAGSRPSSPRTRLGTATIRLPRWFPRRARQPVLGHHLARL